MCRINCQGILMALARLKKKLGSVHKLFWSTTSIPPCCNEWWSNECSLLKTTKELIFVSNSNVLTAEAHNHKYRQEIFKSKLLRILKSGVYWFISLIAWAFERALSLSSTTFNYIENHINNALLSPNKVKPSHVSQKVIMEKV